ncbi:MAG TPA: N-acetylglucosamine-6-phosphate deacetylase, partial [Rhodoglobus sp.]|nr:N-acetylglucosamine-6-phosphate deacetylase [Rhodoglobus sp.]
MADLVLHSARKLDAAGLVDDFWMLVEHGVVVQTGDGRHPSAQTQVDAGGHWLTPGFIDLHGHGAGGHAYDDGAEAILAALRTHRRHGTTRSV